MTDFGKLKDTVISSLVEHGVPVQISEREKLKWPDSPDLWVSVYGWQNFDAQKHLRTCQVVIPDDVELTEVTYSEFLDTFLGNRDEVGINAYSEIGTGIHCACNAHTNLYLRYSGTLGEIIELMNKVG